VASQASNPSGITFNSDGTKMFVIGSTSDSVHQYNLTTGFDVSTASYTQTFSVSSEETSPQGITFNTDGTKMFIVGSSGDDVNEYTLITGFDISTASYTRNFSVALEETSISGIAFNSDGTKMYIVGSSGDDVNEYTITRGNTVPSSDGVSINYDANVLNKGAILGTDYDFDAPAQDKVRITALTANNLKIRVV